MTWNYRVIRHKNDGDEWLAIHEVYYDDDGSSELTTQDPSDIVGETVESLRDTLEYMLESLDKSILNYEEF